MLPPEAIQSPRIRALQQAVEAGDASALAEFWQEVTSSGTPLIEPMAGSDTHSLVTFLWRGGEEHRNVVVMYGVAGEDSAANQLRLLPGTDVWFKSYEVLNDAQTAYIFSLDDPLTAWTAQAWVEHQAAGRALPDPLNPRRVLGEETIFVPESVLRLPAAPPEPWLEARPGTPAGTMDLHLFKSDLLNNERKVWVYTPPGHSAADEPCGWALFLDGGAYYDINTNVILDNLISEGRLPPLAAIFVRNASHAERHLEMSCNPRFIEFLADELLPWLHARYNLTDDPRHTHIVGASYGGLAAVYAAFSRPDVFGNALAQSGAFSWYQGQDREPTPGEDTEPGWLIRQFVEAERLPLCFHLDVGSFEITTVYSGVAHTNILNANRHLRDVLRAKGYPVDYLEFTGGHDFAGWRILLPNALVTLTEMRRQQ